MQRKSSSIVEIKSTNPELIRRAVAEYTGWLFEQFPEVQAVYWFGSWISGIPTPGSDVDLCIVLRESDSAFRDRIPKYLPNRFPVGLDIFPYTADELQAMEADRPQWHRTLTGGRLLEPRTADRKPPRS